jgi:hypothetical protein
MVTIQITLCVAVVGPTVLQYNRLRYTCVHMLVQKVTVIKSAFFYKLGLRKQILKHNMYINKKTGPNSYAVTCRYLQTCISVMLAPIYIHLRKSIPLFLSSKFRSNGHYRLQDNLMLHGSSIYCNLGIWTACRPSSNRNH